MSKNIFIRNADEITEIKKADEISKKHGFDRSYEPETKVTRRRKVKGPSRALNFQLPEDEYNRFVELCEELGDVSYWKALVFLMNEHDIKKGGD